MIQISYEMLVAILALVISSAALLVAICRNPGQPKGPTAIDFVTEIEAHFPLRDFASTDLKVLPPDEARGVLEGMQKGFRDALTKHRLLDAK